MTDQTNDVTNEVTNAPLATTAERTEILDNATPITVDEVTADVVPEVVTPEATVSQEDFNKLYFQLKQTEREKAELENATPANLDTPTIPTATPELTLEQLEEVIKRYPQLQEDHSDTAWHLLVEHILNELNNE